MAQIVEITGVPSKTKADEIARTMRVLFPDWTVEILGGAPPYTVRRTPPGAGAPHGAKAAAAPPAVTDVVRDGALGFLDFIAKYESRGNYNAYFGHASNTNDPSFTSMTVDDVLKWQEDRKYTACGKYQIIQRTLKGLKRDLGIDGTSKFGPELQDQMALRLLERRGLKSFLKGETPRDDFALSVAKEWASLPRVKPPNSAKSYYAGDGVNQALVDVASYVAAIDRLRATS